MNTLLQNSTLNVRQFRGQGFMTVAKYNSTGDLLFIADKDSKSITLISTHDSTIIGTYNGHNGVVWNLDIDYESKYMISCSGDMSWIIWDIRTGTIITQTHEFGIPKYVSIYNNLVMISCDPISKRSKSYLSVYFLSDLVSGIVDPIYKFEEETNQKITTCMWESEDLLIISMDNGIIKKLEYKLNEIILEKQIHSEAIKTVCFSHDKKYLLTSSLDTESKIILTENFQIEKTFKSTVPINCAIFSPDEKYVLLGGGIEAMMVAKTSDNDLTTKIYQVANEKLIKQITNHFGPLRFLSFNPNKSNFTTASQDGTVKIHCLTETIPIHTYELFGQALNKNVEELQLGKETVKIENVEKTIIQTSNVNTKKNLPEITQVYPIGHALYKKETLNSTYKINSKLDIETKPISCIKVSNLPEDIELSLLWDTFEYYGRIENNGIRVKKFYNDTVAFINYLDVESAKKAIEKCDKKKIGFCIIGVEMVHEK